jgi:hypothetical protein
MERSKTLDLRSIFHSPKSTAWLLLCTLPCLFVIPIYLVLVSFVCKPNSLTASSNFWYILFNSFSVLARTVTSSACAHIWLNFVNIVPLLSTFSIAVCRIVLNSVVDKLSPCFTPLLYLNSRPNSFSIFT